MSIYKILEDYWDFKKDDIIETHDSNQQWGLELLVETGRAEILPQPQIDTNNL